MPRIPSSLLKTAFSRSPLLPLLLPPCRTLSSALLELRWLREHAISLSQNPVHRRRHGRQGWRTLLWRYCEERKRGRPLQYILGTQPFGQVEVKCRRGVLIPRAETEAYVTHLGALLLSAGRISNSAPPLRILDLCTGTGCIPLLLHVQLSSSVMFQDRNISLMGIDLSQKAVTLARQNLRWNVQQGNLNPAALEDICFLKEDVLSPDSKDLIAALDSPKWDILISNPPYISPHAFNHSTSRSVRKWEPKTALVPPTSPSHNPSRPLLADGGDFFYPALLSLASRVKAKVLLLEVADLAQAKRVAALAQERRYWVGMEIWRDWPSERSGDDEETVEVGGERIAVKGQGNGRAVFCWTEEGRRLIEP
ncbi:MAG: hypothetical protein M1817_004580 [Caeruleum heppii]|nr:MAG: hypothetical protein M1817_004580 [Caeruleum heppii]